MYVLVATALHTIVYKANGLIEEMILRGGDNNWLTKGTSHCMPYLYAGSHVCSPLWSFLLWRLEGTNGRQNRNKNVDFLKYTFTFAITERLIGAA